jgi:hypothetical protein
LRGWSALGVLLARQALAFGRVGLKRVAAALEGERCRAYLL